MKKWGHFSKGFIAVEAIITVVLVVAVGIGASQLLLKTTQQASNMQHAQKALSLANMVFAQYASYAASNFTTLGLYQPVNVTPKAFFYTADNMGYDNMTLSATVTYAQSRSTCTVNVAVSWQEGSQTKTVNFSKNYSMAMTILGGAVAQVYVKLPCGSYVTQPDIIANCPGIPGVLVSGQSVKGNLSQGITDGNGKVILNQLATLNQNQFTFKALAPSDFTVPPSDPNFVPMYYGQDSFGNYTTSLGAAESIANGSGNIVLFTTLQRAGILSGQLIDDSGTAASLFGSTMTLQNVYAPIGGTLSTSATTYTLTTSANGSYLFSNIILTNSGLLTDNGLMGSAFNVQQGQAGFKWAYYPDALSYAVSPASYISVQGVPTATQDIHLKQAGWIKFHTANKSDGTTIPYATLIGQFPQGPGYSTWTFTFNSDFNGDATLYNVIPAVPSTIEITANAATGGYGGTDGMHSEIEFQYTSTSNIGVQNNAVVPLSPLYRLVGSVHDISPNAGPALYVQMVESWQEYRWASFLTRASVGPAGDFTLDGLYLDNMPGSGNQYEVSLYSHADFYPAFYADYVGTAIDQQTGLPAPHAGLSIGPGSPTFYSNSSGHYDSGPVATGWVSYSTQTIACDASYLCTLSPAVPIPINSSNTSGGVYSGNDAPVLGYHAVDPGWWEIDAPNGSPAPATTIYFWLEEYQVHGIVTDAMTGAPLSNITVEDPTSGSSATTAADGSYTTWANIQNRTSLVTGTLNIQIPPNQQSNGFTYSGTSTFPSIPSAPDPLVPIQQNFQLTPTVGSSV